MKIELWRRLVLWELRHTLRGASFWALAAIVAAVPWLATLVSGSSSPAYTACWQVVVLSVLVSLWTVFSVKRQIAADVADDWLLVLTYREALVSRYLAGLKVGLLLWLVGLLSSLACYRWAWFVDFDCSWAGLLYWCHFQMVVLLSLLQALGLASVVVAAADFLLAPTSVVLFVSVVLMLLWSFLPYLGFVLPIGLLAHNAFSAQGYVWLLSAVVFNVAAIRFGWSKAEDFWAYLKIAQRERERASLGTVRAVVEAGRTAGRSSERERLERARRRLRERGVEPLQAFDRARYPAWMAPRHLTPHARWQWIAGILIATAVAIYWSALSGTASFVMFASYFAWWLLAAGLVIRTLVSASQIVVEEKEQGTLSGLLVAPVGGQGLLRGKLSVILRQALPGLLILTLFADLRWPGLQAVPGLWFTVCSAAVCGVAASAVAGTRLLAILVGAAATALLAAALVLIEAACHWGGIPLAAACGVAGSSICGEVTLPGPLRAASSYGVVVAMLIAAWLIVRGPASHALYRHAAAR